MGWLFLASEDIENVLNGGDENSDMMMDRYKTWARGGEKVQGGCGSESPGAP